MVKGRMKERGERSEGGEKRIVEGKGDNVCVGI